MRRCIALLTTLILSGCYTTAAVIDLAKPHPPSAVYVQRSDDGATLTTKTEHGSRPGDVSMSRWMPDLRIITERVTATRLTPDAARCEPLVATLVDRWDEAPVARDPVGQTPLTIYIGGGFPFRLSPVAYRLSLDPATCWLIGEYPATDRFNPPPEALLIFGDTDALQSIALPVEWGALSWQRWLWLPAAAVVDAAGFVIVPVEWIVLGVSRWTGSSTEGQ